MSRSLERAKRTIRAQYAEEFFALSRLRGEEFVEVEDRRADVEQHVSTNITK
jgi:hypothetical protein